MEWVLVNVDVRIMSGMEDKYPVLNWLWKWSEMVSGS